MCWQPAAKVSIIIMQPQQQWQWQGRGVNRELSLEALPP
jgi:hypothetical protein